MVVAAYNVESYLNDFFASLVAQTLSFSHHIQVVVVDDGSTDESAQLVEKWRVLYPNNIEYVRQLNAGQASARNLGIARAKHPWVTFIDPDDFVAHDYFEKVSVVLDGNKGRVSIVACALKIFREDGARVEDLHPLRSMFTPGSRLVNPYRTARCVQLSAASAFFRMDVIQKNGLSFDPRVRPNFEDGRFILDYLLCCESRQIYFLATATYFYRKRADVSSTIDTSWMNEKKFSDVLKHGYLEALKRYAEARGHVPDFVQWTVLYELTWFFKHLVDNEAAVAHLTPAQRAHFVDLVAQIFEYIEVDNILRFNLAGAWNFYKLGWIAMFKSGASNTPTLYIDGYDPSQGLLRVCYYSMQDKDVSLLWNRDEVVPVYAKGVRHVFVDSTFVYEYSMWIQVPISDATLQAWHEDTRFRLCMGGKHRVSFSKQEIIKTFRRRCRPREQPTWNTKSTRWLANTTPVRGHFRNAWLFMDRNTQADDNAEHLYRYVREHQPGVNAYFVLNRSSHDWMRLSRDGFRLIEHGSLQHRLALLSCSRILSSHADAYIMHPLNARQFGSQPNRRFIFLQHGVTKNSMARWFNKKPFDVVITASAQEHAAMVRDGSRYRFTNKEVVLTGFPRHDRLVRERGRDAKSILIMPTWRNYLVGKQLGRGNERAVNESFATSEYAQAWKAVLHSPELRRLADQHGYRLCFFPHANMQPYLKMFDVPGDVEVLRHDDVRIQDAFLSAAFMLTDYSSVDVEMAVLRRSTIYYQFDADTFFSGAHVCSKGEFDYETQGFGPVCHDLNGVVNAASDLLDRGGQPGDGYLDRMNQFLAFDDDQSCRRVYRTIASLDDRVVEDGACVDKLVGRARRASNRRSFELATQRWATAAAACTGPVEDEILVGWAEACLHTERWERCQGLLEALREPGHIVARYLRAELSFRAKQWPESRELWQEVHREAFAYYPHAPLRLAAVCRALGELDEAHRWLLKVDPEAVDPTELAQEMAAVAFHILKRGVPNAASAE